MLLSKPAILRHRESGEIIIDTFEPLNLGNASYDVTLGEWFYAERPPARNQLPDLADFECPLENSHGRVTMPPHGRFKDGKISNSGSHPVYNPRNEKQVLSVWEKRRAMSHRELIEQQQWLTPLEGIGLDDEVILVGPGETILGHTREYIGGAKDKVDTMMKARSTMGRNFFEVCKCAGLGDIGYCNRWTMEITNNSRFYSIPLVVGSRVAQLLFFECEPIKAEDVYGVRGKYQSVMSLEELKASWKPEQMLPKQYRDRECVKVA